MLLSYRILEQVKFSLIQNFAQSLLSFQNFRLIHSNANSNPSYLLNAIDVDFDFAFSLKNELDKDVFRLVEASGLRKFLLASSQEIYLYELLCIYENGTVNIEWNIIMSVLDHSLLLDEDLFATLFQLLL